MAITIPALNAVQRQAASLRCMNNLKQIGTSANLYAADHRERYPESVATAGTGATRWRWSDPRRLVAVYNKTPSSRRTVSAYLRPYLENVELLVCPGAPAEWEYAEDMWQAGEQWDHPGTLINNDPVSGNYGLYWNYEGLLNAEDTDREMTIFRGPRGPASSGKYSKMLASDHFGYGNINDHSPPNRYTSCESFEGGSPRGTGVDDIAFPYWWSQPGGFDIEDRPRVDLRAVFTDGHVEEYRSFDTVPMWVIMDRSSHEFTRLGRPGLGVYYLPNSAVPQQKR